VDDVYDVDDAAVTVHRLLAGRGATVAVAESLTGGLLGAALTAAAGSSATFQGGITAYATPAKTNLLGVPADLLTRHGPVHAEVAAAMAAGARERLAATYGLATTGVAGPQPQDGTPAGTVFLAVSGPDGVVMVQRRLSGERARVRHLTVVHALDLLRRTLEGRPPYTAAEHEA
jgi:nicotinamide-nucleotide amidase